MSQQQPAAIPGPMPQNAAHSNKPGSYELAIRANKAEVVPGDIVEVEVFITGYGMITGAKIVFYPPQYFINSTWSVATYGLGRLPNGSVGWGVGEQPIRDEGCTLMLAGIQASGWPEASSFFDNDSRPGEPVHQIASEIKNPRAPAEFTLHIQDKNSSGHSIPSGNHELIFYLTYFNGQEWRSSAEKITLSVPNFFKRHEGWTWAIGIVTFVVTVADPIISLFRY